MAGLPQTSLGYRFPTISLLSPWGHSFSMLFPSVPHFPLSFVLCASSCFSLCRLSLSLCLSQSLQVGKGLCLSLGVYLSPSVFSFLPSPQVSPLSLAFTLSTLPVVILLHLSKFPFSSLPSPTRSQAGKEWSQCPRGLRKGMVDCC